MNERVEHRGVAIYPTIPNREQDAINRDYRGWNSLGFLLWGFLVAWVLYTYLFRGPKGRR